MIYIITTEEKDEVQVLKSRTSTYFLTLVLLIFVKNKNKKNKIKYTNTSHIQYQKTNQKWTEDLNRHFSKEHIQKTNKHMKRCSTSLFIREMLLKTIIWYHSHGSEWPPLESTQNKCWRGCGGKDAPPTLLVGIQLGAATMGKNSVEISEKKLKIQLPYDLTTSVLGLYLEKTKTLIQKDTYNDVHSINT